MGVTIAVGDSGGGYLGSCGILHDAYETFHEYGNVTNTHGAHTLKIGANVGVKRLATGRYGQAGGSYTFSPNFTQGPDPLVASSLSGFGFASYLLGAGSGGIGSDGPGQNGIAQGLPWSLSFIDGGYWLVVLVLSGAIIGALGV